MTELLCSYEEYNDVIIKCPIYFATFKTMTDGKLLTLTFNISYLPPGKYSLYVYKNDTR